MTYLFDRVVRRVTSHGRRLRHRHFDDFVFIHINKTGGSSVETALRLSLEHKTAREKIAELGRREWERRFTFTIVRNPWDKVVSHYHYRVQTNQTALGTDPIPFDEWVLRAYGERDPRYHDQPRMFMPQLDWIADEDGVVLVDHICRFESLADDVAEATAQFRQPVVLPHVKRSPGRGHYHDHYTDAARAVVAERFAADIERFGYTF